MPKLFMEVLSIKPEEVLVCHNELLLLHISYHQARLCQAKSWNAQVLSLRIIFHVFVFHQLQQFLFY